MAIPTTRTLGPGVGLPRCLITALLPILFNVQTSAAQTIAGSVVDAVSGQSIEQVRVELQTREGTRIAEALTDYQGRFVLRGRPGQFIIAASILGYRAITSDTVRLASREIVHVTLRMSRDAIPLEPITVTARSMAFHDMTYDGLYARRAVAPAVGSFRVWVKGDRDFESAIKAGDLLLHMKPRKFVGTGNSRRQCTPFLFRQGILVRKLAGAYLEDSTVFLEGVEIYMDWHSLPFDFRAQLDVLPSSVRDCGVVAIWMRRPDYPKR